MVCTPSWMSTVFRTLQKSKACRPMDFTFPGMVMEVSLSQFKNAELPIFVTVVGMITLFK